jgi:hypothetical protein
MSCSSLPFFAQADLADRSTGIWIVDLSEKAESRTRDLARTHAASTNSILIGLLINAFCEIVGRGEIDFFTAVSVRERLGGEAITDFGCYIDVVATPIKMQACPLETATCYHRMLHDAIRAYRPVLKTHKEIRTTVEAAAKAQAFAGLGASNVGNIDPVFGGDTREILAYRTAANRAGGNVALTPHIVRLRGRTSLVFTYPRPLMPDDVVARTGNLFKQGLNAL